MSVLYGVLSGIGQVLYYTWWLWAFLILLPLFQSTWLFWRQEEAREHVSFVLLELNIPREIKTSPMAMEQVLIAIHALRNAAGDIKETWVMGETTRIFSLEVASFGGEVHFYVRVPTMHQALVEAAFFSYYPDIEIVEVPDYADRFPKSTGEMYRNGYDIWATEMLLERSEAYPIKSYIDFESPDEEKQYDPMGVLIEVLGKAKKEETVALQIVIAPGAPDWKDEFQEVVEKLRSKRQEGKKPGAKMGVEFPHLLPVFPVTGGGEEGEEPTSTFARALSRTPGETETLKAIEDNLSRPGFKTIVRYVYFSPKELYQDNYPRRAILAAFNQYRALDLNAFRRNEIMTTKTKFLAFPFLFSKVRLEYRKQRMLISYPRREMPPETWMGEVLMSHFFNKDSSEAFFLNTRSIATLFHPPTYRIITAPHIKRVESRKAGPPAGLAIYGDEEEMERYK